MQEDFIQRATSTVERCFGSEALITLVQPIKDRERNIIARLFLSGGGAPESVIAKGIVRDEARGFTDVAGLRFLATIPGMEMIAPHFYGSTEDGRLFLMEDLGGSRSLEQVFAEGDVPATLRHLESLAAAKAKLSGGSLGLEARYLEIRGQYPGSAEIGREVEVTAWRTGLSRVRRWADLLELNLDRSFTLALQQLAQGFVEVAPEALAYSHGDPAPTNNHVAADGHVCLLDFEYGAYRHIYYDLSGWNVLCPLPHSWVTALVAAFRRESSAWLPQITDEAWHTREWAAVCAYRAIAMLTWLPESALEQDREWVGDWSVRAALISTALRLREATRAVGEFAPLHEFGAQLAAGLQARWPEHGDGAIEWPGA